MGKIRKNQSGFSTVEILLALILVSIIAFVGYYVYHTQKNANNTSKTVTSNIQSTSKRNTTSTDNNADYFVFKEWGIRAKYSGNLTLEYNLKTDSTSGEHYAQLSSAQLDALDAGCKSSQQYGGTLSRYLAADDLKLSDGTSSGKTAAQSYDSADSNVPKAHVGNYFYFYSHPQGVCADPAKDDGSTQSNTISAFQDIVKNLEAAPAQ